MDRATHTVGMHRFWRLITGVLALALLVTGLGAPGVVARADAPPPPVLLRPVPGGVVRPFEAPAQRWGAGHRGVDLSAAVGAPVLAAADGTVAFVGRVVDRDVLSIDHAGGYRTTYEPVHAVVRAGEHVSLGQLVGYLEAGDECPSGCLHLGLRQGRDYLDPMAWLSADGVRLLPNGSHPQARPVAPAPASLMPELQAPVGASGALARPVQAPITSPFGMRFHPVLHVWKLHDGTDFGAPCGARVGSAASGRVVAVEYNIAYGNRVVVDHGSVGGVPTRTAYNHLTDTSVSIGQVVRQGQLVGHVGTTGFSTGCHLHFMVWRKGELTNPMTVLR